MDSARCCWWSSRCSRCTCSCTCMCTFFLHRPLHLLLLLHLQLGGIRRACACGCGCGCGCACMLRFPRAHRAWRGGPLRGVGFALSSAGLDLDQHGISSTGVVFADSPFRCLGGRKLAELCFTDTPRSASSTSSSPPVRRSAVPPTWPLRPLSAPLPLSLCSLCRRQSSPSAPRRLPLPSRPSSPRRRLPCQSCQPASLLASSSPISLVRQLTSQAPAASPRRIRPPRRFLAPYPYLSLFSSHHHPSTNTDTHIILTITTISFHSRPSCTAPVALPVDSVFQNRLCHSRPHLLAPALDRRHPVSYLRSPLCRFAWIPSLSVVVGVISAINLAQPINRRCCPHPRPSPCI